MLKNHLIVAAIIVCSALAVIPAPAAEKLVQNGRYRLSEKELQENAEVFSAAPRFRRDYAQLSTGSDLTSPSSSLMFPSERDREALGTSSYSDFLLTSTLSTTSPSLSLLPDFSTTGILDLDMGIYDDYDTTFAEPTKYNLPDSPLPTEELERLTSTSAAARHIGLMPAVCRALEANQSLRIEKLRPEVTNTGIESAESEFDTVLESGLFTSSRHSPTLGPRPRDGERSGSRSDQSVSRNTDFDVAVRGRLPTGTNYSLGFNANRNVTNRTHPFYTLNANLNITQNLLRGAGCEVNCLRVWIAQNNFVVSLYQLQQVLIDLVTNVQNSYWDMYLALRNLEIQRQAYEVAREQRERTEEFVRVGKSPPLDLLASQAEESARISDIINAAADLKKTQLQFLRLLNPENQRDCWETILYPSQEPLLPEEPLVPVERVCLARFYRPDLRQAQLDLDNGEMGVIETENGLLPALDLVTDLGYTGVGDSFGDAADMLEDRDFRNWRVGLQFSYPLQNRAARASHRRATFQRDISVEAIRNFEQIIEVDVRTAIIEIERTVRLITSTEVTRRLREEELEAEVEKFRVGLSTPLLVAQAQRDLTQAQLAEVQAKVANIKAYLQLYRAEGTSLQRLGIQPICITEAAGVD